MERDAEAEYKEIQKGGMYGVSAVHKEPPGPCCPHSKEFSKKGRPRWLRPVRQDWTWSMKNMPAFLFPGRLL